MATHLLFSNNTKVLHSYTEADGLLTFCKSRKLLLKFISQPSRIVRTRNWLMILIVGLTNVGWSQCFTSPTSFTTSGQLQSVTVGDFNGDGKPDLAVVGVGSNNVSVFLGMGTGSFGMATTFPTGNSPRSVAVGDFNSDGKLDLVTANTGNDVSVLLGTGSGTFVPFNIFTVGTNPRSVVVNDFNGDGILDLATANYNSGDVSILLGTGTGSFGTVSNYPAPNYAISIAVGDFNGDGKPDLAVVGDGGGGKVLLNTGTGNFETAITFSAGGRSLAVGDLNGDGKLDLVTVNPFGPGSVLLGTGTGSFVTTANFPPGNVPNSVAMDDFNGDGNLDLVVLNLSTSRTTSKLQIRLGDGTGNFGPVTNINANESVSTLVATSDLNGDGKPDLIATGFSGDGNNGIIGGVSVLLNCSISLPVDLISFQGELIKEQALLTWKTAWERTNKGFEIQKSTDAQHYEVIGWVDGVATSNQMHSYQFIDSNLISTSYYRLRQVDFDGSSSLTRSVAVVPDRESIKNIIAYPNPSPDGHVMVQLPQHVTYLRLVDELGREIHQIGLPGIEQSLELPKSGVYLLLVQTKVEKKTIKLTRP